MAKEIFNTLRRRVEDELQLTEARQAAESARLLEESAVVAKTDNNSRKPKLNRRAYAYRQPVPDDLWIRCPECQGIMFRDDFLKQHNVCMNCHFHFRINALERLDMVVDYGTFKQKYTELKTINPLEFPGYEQKIEQLQHQTGLQEAIVAGRGKVDGIEVMIAAMDSRFMMGAMGSVLGEVVTRLFEDATEARLPVVIFTVSGGARMQEGILSLMQMAKTSAAVERHGQAGLLYISYLTDPTTGGVTASFASLGDLVVSEPGAIIGFAGRRVIEGTIDQQLPENFQRSEFLKNHGFLDRIIPRSKCKDELAQLLVFHNPDQAEMSSNRLAEGIIRARKNGVRNHVAETLPPVNGEHKLRGSEALALSHHKKRPNLSDYLPLIFEEIIELSGDRFYGEDEAMFGGLALLGDQPVTVIGHQKGKDLRENKRRNFGMPHPEGYRKALRLMEQAEKFGRPIITFVDTAGAYCGVGAEERGQGQAIANNLAVMSRLKTPIVTVVIGEGGSGGALGIAVCDRLGMLENSMYSVISPRGFASLLWKDPAREEEAADTMRLTSYDVKNLGICDTVIPEGGTTEEPLASATSGQIRSFLLESLNDLSMFSDIDLVQRRYDRYRSYGRYTEES